MSLYLNIRSVANIVRKDISSIWSSENLAGACGLASWHLMTVLNSHGHKSVFRYVPGHCWVETDNYAVDVTATQFNSDSIYLQKIFTKVVVVRKSTYYNYDTPQCIKWYLKTPEAKTYKRPSDGLKLALMWTERKSNFKAGTHMHIDECLTHLRKLQKKYKKTPIIR